MPLTPGPGETLHESPNEIVPPDPPAGPPALWCVPDGAGGKVVVYFRTTAPGFSYSGPYYPNDRTAAEAACV